MQIGRCRTVETLALFLQIQGDLSLPSSDVMLTDIRKKKEAIRNRYVKSTRHTIQVDFQPFMDEIAELCGCKPDLRKYCNLPCIHVYFMILPSSGLTLD